MDGDRTSGVHEGMDDREESWGFQSIVLLRKVVASGIYGKLRQAQCTCENDGKAVSSTIVELT